MTRTACGRSDFCSVRRCRLTAPSPPPTPEKAWLLALTLTLSALILIHVQILMLIKVQAHIQIRIKVLIQIKYSQVHKYLDTDNCFWFCASTQYILNETAQMQSFSFNSVGWTKKDWIKMWGTKVCLTQSLHSHTDSISDNEVFISNTLLKTLCWVCWRS